jgi:hypothetical protein
VITAPKIPGIIGTVATNVGASYVASGVPPIIGSFTAAGQSAPFMPNSGPWNFYIGLDGTFVATIQLERKTYNSAIWRPITTNGIQIYIWTSACCEAVEEHQSGTQYRLNCTSYTSGTAYYVIEQ